MRESARVAGHNDNSNTLKSYIEQLKHLKVDGSDITVDLNLPAALNSP